MTANFKCGHCGNLMGVSDEHLGQQVRCPSCHQVVFAQASPTPAGAPPEAPQPAPSEAPQLGAPPDAPASPQPAPADPAEVQPAPEPAAWASPEAAPPGQVNGQTAAPAPWPLTDAPGARADGGPAARRRGSPRGGWLVPLVVLPLAIWAAGATAAAIWGWSEVVKANRRPNLFDQFPDVEGDNPGVRRARPAARLDWSPATATGELPAHLRVPLGGVLGLGDLEVRPLRVERRKVKVYAAGEARELPHEALVLTLRFKNVSADHAFAPLDNYFDRRWEGEGPPPLTVLQAGKTLFWGGSHRWAPRERARGAAREWPCGAGRDDGDSAGLGPGASEEAVVTTNGEDAEVGRVLFGVEPGGRAADRPAYRGPLLWRVQVRRGLVPWRGKGRPACAVVGVELSDEDYARKED